MDAKKALRRQNLFRTLKTVSYLLGFPLMLLLLMQSAYALGFGVKGIATEYVVIAWAGVTAVQILVTIITKSYSARAVSVVIVSVILLLGFSVFFDFKAKDKLNAAAEGYARDYYRLEKEDSVKVYAKGDTIYADITYADSSKENIKEAETPIKSYNEHLSEFKPWSGGSGLSASINSKRSGLISTYNINGSGGGNKNTDGTKGGAAPEIIGNDPEIWFGETGAVYNPNGLYADSYIFGVEQTIQILLTIYRTQNDYEAKGLDADVALAAAYAEAESSSEWISYMASDEYQNAYGPDGKAYNYMLTEKRLDELLSSLGSGVVSIRLVNAIMALAESSLPVTKSDLQNLDLQKVADIIDGLDNFDIKTVAGSLGVVIPDGMSTRDALVKLVYKFCFYQMPNVLPSMYFIKDKELRAYAYAKYYAEVHGYNNACVLYAEDQENGRIGGITMSDNGNPISAAYSEEDLCAIRAINSYSGNLFPLMLLRRYAMYFAAFVALAYLLAYFFAYKQQMYAVIIKNGIYND